MAEPKTKPTKASVKEFLNQISDKERRDDCFTVAKMMEEITGDKPKMWGPTIIGFGSYHYKYASGHEGDAPIIGFSPRKAQFSLYVTVPGHEDEKLVGALGNIKRGKACIYFKKLADLDLDVLEKIVKATMDMHVSRRRV